MAKNWSEQEEEVILKCVNSFSYNKRFAFEKASSMIGRSATSCCTRYYDIILPRLNSNDLSMKHHSICNDNDKVKNIYGLSTTIVYHYVNTTI